MELTILSTSDIHGYVFPTNYVKQGSLLPFGLARVATIMKEERQKANGPVITIDDGDFLEGSPLAYYVAQVQPVHNPQWLMDAYNQIGYDCGVLGNHEFNYGKHYLKLAINESDRHFVNANVLNADGQAALGQPFRIINRNGLKVAILGLTTQTVAQWERQDNIEGLHFQSAVETACYFVPFLHQLADVVVVAYHGGFERDLNTGKPTEKNPGENEAYQLLKDIKGIDALITGHQHRHIAAKVFGTPVTQPGFRGDAIGKITLQIEKKDDRFVVEDSQAELVYTKEAPLNKAIMESTASLDREVDSWLEQPLGKIDGSLTVTDPFQARITESAYIEFIQRVQMATMGVDISATALFNNEGAGFENPITMRNIMTNYVYPDGLAVVQVTGKELKEALERSARYFVLDNDGEIAVNPSFVFPKHRQYNYDMYEGVNYEIRVSEPVGNRIQNLTYHDQPVKDDEPLKIVLNHYRAGGGGHYDMFSEDKIIAENKTSMSQIIADYLREHPLIKADVNHNFKVIK